MRYVRIEGKKVSFIDGMKKVHEITYASDANLGDGTLLFQHIRHTANLFEWGDYEIFIFKGDYWWWQGNAYANFKEAYDAAKG